jgi:hypothetical protein
MSDEDIKYEYPRLWPAEELQAAEQPRWLARNRVPRGAISLLIGDEGIGKSLLWVWVVAAVTTGKALFEFGIPARDPGRVILVVTEDGWSSDALPRLLVAGADVSMIDVICTEPDGSGSPIFPRDLHLIRDAYPAPALIVVDCWLDTVEAGMSVRDPQQARKALHPWKDVAVTTDAAVLLLGHTNRISSGSVRDRYGATGALRQKARMTLFAQEDDEGCLVVGPEKANGTAPVAAARFVIDPVQYFDATDDHDGTVPLLRYIGDSTLTAREHAADSYDAEHGEDRQDRAEAEKWLEEYLRIEGPSAKSSEAKRSAKAAGISERTLQRARKALGVIIGYIGNPPVSTWTLPTPASDGTTPNGGTTTGQDAMPRSATDDDWHSVAQGDDHGICHETPVVPMTDRYGRAMHLVTQLNQQTTTEETAS